MSSRAVPHIPDCADRDPRGSNLLAGGRLELALFSCRSSAGFVVEHAPSAMSRLGLCVFSGARLSELDCVGCESQPKASRLMVRRSRARVGDVRRRCWITLRSMSLIRSPYALQAGKRSGSSVSLTSSLIFRWDVCSASVRAINHLSLSRRISPSRVRITARAGACPSPSSTFKSGLCLMSDVRVPSPFDPHLLLTRHPPRPLLYIFPSPSSRV